MTDQGAESVALFLNSAPPMLTTLNLHFEVRQNVLAETILATAITRNFTLQTLECISCPGAFVSNVVQQLAESANSPSAISRIEIHYATHRRLAKIVQGLIQNSLVQEVSFVKIGTNLDDEEEAVHDAVLASELVKLVQFKSNLSALQGHTINFFKYQPFVEALSEVLMSHESPLLCLHLSLPHKEGSLMRFKDILSASAFSTQLKKLVICNVHVSAFKGMEGMVHSLKEKELTLRVLDEPNSDKQEQETYLINVLKGNYTISSILCKVDEYHGWFIDEEENDWFSEENQACLDAYLDRNCKLAQWTANPKLVPAELWSYAIILALKAGVNSLYQSLLALSGHGVGLQKRGQ